MSIPIIPSLWFDGQAEQAAELCCSVFPSSRILGKAHTRRTRPAPRAAS